jgi:hypothetical protein
VPRIKHKNLKSECRCCNKEVREREASCNNHFARWAVASVPLGNGRYYLKWPYVLFEFGHVQNNGWVGAGGVQGSLILLKYDVLRGVGVKMQIVMHEWAVLQGSNTPNCLAVVIRRMAGMYEEGSRRISIFKYVFKQRLPRVSSGWENQVIIMGLWTQAARVEAPKDSLKPLKPKIATRWPYSTFEADTKRNKCFQTIFRF